MKALGEAIGALLTVGEVVRTLVGSRWLRARALIALSIASKDLRLRR